MPTSNSHLTFSPTTQNIIIKEKALGRFSRPNNDFDKLLLETVDETLSSMGNSVKQAIYFHLEKRFGIRRQDIPNKIEEFADAIESIFGMGAKLLEIRMMERLYEKIGRDFKYTPKEGDILFASYLEIAKAHFRRSRKRKRS